jgi:uncharacterized membrane protein YbjE (DUF340 family)
MTIHLILIIAAFLLALLAALFELFIRPAEPQPRAFAHCLGWASLACYFLSVALGT